MIELPTAAALQATRGTSYGIRHEAHPDIILPDLRLLDVEIGGDARHESVAMIFAGERSRLLPQDTYHLSHPDLGEHALFIVPLGERDGDYQYQCIISRLREDG
ncbi:MAG: DUF6916 family protein [Gammaproteobacteria bacterium]